MSDDALLQPLRGYNLVYKEKFKNKAEEYFDALKDKAGIDVELNRETIKKLRKAQAERNALLKKMRNQKALRGWTIFFIIFFFIACPVMIVLGPVIKMIPNIAAIISAVGALIVAVALIIVIIKILKPRIKTLQDKLAEKDQIIAQLTAEAERQMSPLNSLYDWNMAAVIFSDVIPLVELDRFFDSKKHALMVQKYGLDGMSNPDISSIYVQSGSILGNPILLQKAKVHQIIDKTYTGSITISWTTTVSDGKGGIRTVTHTQTLTASVTKPAPDYHHETRLILANPAAPDLVFSRKPQGMTGKDEKQIYKFVRKQEKELASLAEKSISRGGNFTPLGNTDFEALFHAWNRNHEQQFRLLFTPLAQQNEIELVTLTDGFGDDFQFYKTKMINEISSKHSQKIDYSGNPLDYYSIEYDDAKRKFVDYVCVFCKGLYFDLAPLLSIPLYQQTKSLEFIYGEDTPENYSYYEHEVMANSFKADCFAHEDTTTDVILKTSLISKDGKSDKVLVNAYSYRGEPRVTIVSKLGGDGHMHQIPVHWTEYIPIEKETTMEVANTNASRFDFNNKIMNNGFSEFIRRYATNGTYSFRRGLLALLGAAAYTAASDSEMDTYFHSEE